jgi:hypothetical protein
VFFAGFVLFFLERNVVVLIIGGFIGTDLPAIVSMLLRC